MAEEQNTNSYNAERTAQIVARIEERHAMIESIMGRAKQECKGVHEDIADIYTEAKDAWGLPKRSLKQVIRTRALERKLEDIRENLEPDDQESYDQIRHALGDLADLPLGAAVLGDEDDFRPLHLRQNEADRAAETEYMVLGNGAEAPKRGRGRPRKQAPAEETAALDAAAIDNGAERLRGLNPNVN